MHEEVARFLKDNNLEHMIPDFGLLGIYTHHDIVQLSMDLRCRSGAEYLCALSDALQLDETADSYRDFVKILLNYACPLENIMQY